ncbi:MAG: hypothetical protein ABIP17_10335 [Ilumatobacteraceae bacterium]
MVRSVGSETIRLDVWRRGVHGRDACYNFPVRRLLVLLVTLGSLTVTSPTGAQATPAYEPLAAPQRLLDTRPGETTVDGHQAGVGKRAAGSAIVVDVAGRAGLGVGLGSVVLNVTVDQPDGPGFVTVWPCDRERPNASNVNYAKNQTVGVAAISRVSVAGTVCLWTLASAHLIVDVAGHFPTGSFEPLAAPERLADTRAQAETIDGAFSGGGRPAAGSVYEMRVAGRGSVPSGAAAVALSVTATDVDRPGFLTVYPCDSPRPNASNVNYEPGLTTPNAVITRLDAEGDVCIFTLSAVHLVIDVAGSMGRAVFEPLPEPRRLLDTRVGEVTYDGRFAGGGVQPNGSTVQLDVAARVGIPPDATAVVLNVTSTGSSGPGFVTAHPQGSGRPQASNVNFTDRRTVANMVVAALGPDGDVCLFNFGVTQLVVDVAGWLTGPTSPAPTATSAFAGEPCPGRAADETADAYRNVTVRRPALQRTVGVDRIGLYICKIPADSTQFAGVGRHMATSGDFAAFAQAEVAPYFESVSGGRYRVEFTALGDILAGRDDGPAQCLDEAERQTGAPFTNVLVAGSTFGGGGFASPGRIFTSDLAPNSTVLDRSPTQSGRGGWVGGSVISDRPNAATIVHEIGHTIHWPHSYVGPNSEYDNPVDVMSGGQGRCRAGTVIYGCSPGNTIAFNRLAGGWLRDGEVITHRSGTVNYRLDAPGSGGLQLVVLPDPGEPLSTLTIEGRPGVGRDSFFERAGVALHVVDQRSLSGGLSGLSTGRIHRQALGDSNTYEHVIPAGESVTVHGVTVEVLRRSGDGFDVRVTGSYRVPDASFFAGSIGTGHAASCAALSSEQALAEPCAR